jgi:hypothetical protein
MFFPRLQYVLSVVTIFSIRDYNPNEGLLLVVVGGAAHPDLLLDGWRLFTVVTRAVRGVGIRSSIVRPLFDVGGIVGGHDLLVAMVGAQWLLQPWWRHNDFSSDSATGAGSGLMVPSSREATMTDEERVSMDPRAKP